uniref:Ig-like domain-containing protein n=1 Tax=Meloidogyne hapla TaxID=6305 RepID=A0A1I8BJ40_MELHA
MNFQSFSLIILNILLNVIIVISFTTSPQWVMQRKSDRYKFNERCMNRQKDELERFGLQPLRAVVALENSSLWLRCFECLHPDDADELEDKWKPSPSAIGRRIQSMLKFIKEKIAQAKKHKRRPTVIDELAKYYWQKSVKLENRTIWKKATYTFNEKGRGLQDEVMDFIDRIFSKDKDKKAKKGELRNMFLGDHYELELRKLTAADHSGWYRCVGEREKKIVEEKKEVKTTVKTTTKKPTGKKTERPKKESKPKNTYLDIAQIQFLDVVPTMKIRMVHVDNSEDSCANKNVELWVCNQLPPLEKSEAQRKFENFFISDGFDNLLEVYGRVTEWSQCNKCGIRFGETRRTVQCYIRRKPISQVPDFSDYTKKGLDVFILFGELPCLSSLIPLNVRNAIKNLDLTVVEEYTECRISCVDSGKDTKLPRNVTLEEEGKVEVVDVLEPGEYSTDERLPPLAPPIIRRTIFATESQTLLLDCSNQDGLSLIWRRNFEELNNSHIFATNETKRLQLTSNGQLIIQNIMAKDGGFYSCTGFPSGHIFRTFRIIYLAGDKTKDFLEKVTIVFRVILFFYLLILMIDLLSRHAPNV